MNIQIYESKCTNIYRSSIQRLKVLLVHWYYHAGTVNTVMDKGYFKTNYIVRLLYILLDNSRQ